MENAVENNMKNNIKMQQINMLIELRNSINVINTVNGKVALEIVTSLLKMKETVYLSEDVYYIMRKMHKASAEELQELVINMLDMVISDNKIYTCNVCKNKVSFLPMTKYYEFYRRKNDFPFWNAPFQLESETKYGCPICGAYDRDRLIVSFLEELKPEGDEKLNMLEVAPASITSAWANNKEYINYETSDLFMDGVTYKADLQDMNMVADEKYDIILCSHVLEHVKEDWKAMAELYRMLKSDGVCIVLVPLVISSLCTETTESFGHSEEYNWEHFGQNDHARLYNKNDFIGRLKRVGFYVNELGKDYFGEEYYQQYGFDNDSILYVLTKKEIIN